MLKSWVPNKKERIIKAGIIVFWVKKIFGSLETQIKIFGPKDKQAEISSHEKKMQ